MQCRFRRQYENLKPQTLSLSDPCPVSATHSIVILKHNLGIRLCDILTDGTIDKERLALCSGKTHALSLFLFGLLHPRIFIASLFPNQKISHPSFHEEIDMTLVAFGLSNSRRSDGNRFLFYSPYRTGRNCPFHISHVLSKKDEVRSVEVVLFHLFSSYCQRFSSAAKRFSMSRAANDAAPECTSI